MESKVILKYWPIRGLAQSIRYLLSYTEIPFNDEYYDNRDKWFNEDKPNLKSPFPNIPYLIDEGKTITESEAILWYVAYKSKNQDLVGTSDEQKVLIIQFIGIVKDFLGEIFTFCKTQEGTEDNIKNLFTKSIVPRFQKLSKHLTDQGTKFLVGDKVTIADFLLYETLNAVLTVSATGLDSAEVIKKYHQNFQSIPQISGYEASNKFFAKPFLPTTYKFAI